MKILKRGKAPEEPEFDITCVWCKSVLRCNPHELTRYGVYFAFICPVCKRSNHIAPSELMKGKVIPDER